MKKYIYHYWMLFLLSISSNLLVYPQENIKASFEAAEGKVFIYYQLSTDAQQEYDVSVKLRRTSDPSFELVPSVLIGDVGKGKYGEGKRTIIWQINPQEEKLLTGTDFYFEVTASKIEKERGGIPWYVYAGGVALAGGTAAYLLLNKKSEENKTTISSFPVPPARPGN